MIIRVMYSDDRYDMVKDFLLDDLIASGKVRKFYRQSEGWVIVGKSPVRGMGGGTYRGPERRKTLVEREPVLTAASAS